MTRFKADDAGEVEAEGRGRLGEGRGVMMMVMSIKRAVLLFSLFGT